MPGRTHEISASSQTFYHNSIYLKRSRAPDKLACGSACSFAAARRTHTGISGGFTALKFFSCQGRRERLQQAAAPPSSAHFVSYAVAFYIAAYGSACSFAAARNRWQSHLPPLASQAALSHFTLRLKPRKMRGTYTEIARLQPDCNFSVKPRKMRRSGGHLASVTE